MKIYTYLYEDYGVPSFAALVMVAKKNIDPSLVKKMQTALSKASEFIIKNPKQAWELFKTYRLELDTPANKHAWDCIIPYISVNATPPSSKHQAAIIDFLKKHDLVK